MYTIDHRQHVYTLSQVLQSMAKKKKVALLSNKSIWPFAEMLHIGRREYVFKWGYAKTYICCTQVNKIGLVSQYVFTHD